MPPSTFHEEPEVEETEAPRILSPVAKFIEDYNVEEMMEFVEANIINSIEVVLAMRELDQWEASDINAAILKFVQKQKMLPEVARKLLNLGNAKPV